MTANDPRDERNLDPITAEPGAHPVGAGVGAAGGGMAGAAIGAIGGPIGAAIGLVAGALVGGLAGKATAERINPTAEHAYWREAYTREPYYEAGRSYDDYGPAYAYGWMATTIYAGPFDEVQAQMARDWDRERGNSSLAWEQAQPAVRAAWERAQSTVAVARDEEVDRDALLEGLNDLVKTNRDGEKGFADAAAHAQSAGLKKLLETCAQGCAQAAQELVSAIQDLGAQAHDRGSASGALLRGWLNARGSIGSLSDLEMLEECERGEEAAVARYRNVLEQSMPASVEALLQRQLAAALHNQDQITWWRDAERARAG
jgi:uncharacterized protein (TIGR02284 family)